ncbi:MAG TPA: hypothetical protein VJU87_03235, partial [Gemmatimonadaceae bacterium]|nr:hypothetical protein [Gemmatimonadaceae bacterium]
GFAHAQTPVRVVVSATAPGSAIPADFAGISMETRTLLPDRSGRDYFQRRPRALLATFAQLGIHNLRVGGNTADNPRVPIPADSDIAHLFAFARAAHVRVIYTLRLRGDVDPRADAVIAKYVMDHHREHVLCFEVGNEPNIYAKSYARYRELMTRFIAVITAPEVAPGAQFCGPNTTPDKADWARQFATDFAGSGRVTLITQHAYPGGNARTVVDTAAARERMLSPAWVGGYERFFQAFGPTAAAQGLPFRIEETNSFYNGGLHGASDTHAAALWALDYLHWWATHGAAGVNFHTGDWVAAGDDSTRCRYALFWATSDGYDVHPIGYAVKAFDLGSHGRVLPVQVTPAAALNLTGYAVLAADSSIYVTLINKEPGTAAGSASTAIVTLTAGHGWARAESMALRNSSIAATSGETLGGAAIGHDGSWTGTWTRVAAPRQHELQLTLRPATAVIVHLRMR